MSPALCDDPLSKLFHLADKSVDRFVALHGLQTNIDDLVANRLGPVLALALLAS
jgi:hypothetical protein